ncbi:MAG: HD-GYP domain-containing protein [Pseudomonadales bacterium]|nr:HD-GYP domain-containing protein [Pseudomonadales bacterium]
MLKRIDVRHLRMGMFIQEFCGSWMEHPFWRSKFLLKSEQDLKRILASAIREVWIDSERGLDVEEGSGQTEEEAVAEVESKLAEAAAPVTSKVEQTGLEEEVQRALGVCQQARGAVKNMFQDVRMGKAIDAEQLQPLVEQIASSVMRHPGAIISLARLKNKNEYTYMHSVAVCALMTALAKQLQMDEKLVYEAGMAGLLHDIGKAAIPNEVLDKPGKLTEKEFDLVKTHPVEGHLMLLEGKGVGPIPLDVCLHHHEKVDGSGYPHGLVGDQISLLARMGAVCDVYDAVTSDRPYKRGWNPAEALRKMAEWSKGHFDDRVFQAFVKTIGIYPTGSLIRLESQRLAIVLEQSGTLLLKPRVKVFFSVKAKMPIPAQVLDLSSADCEDKIIARENPDDWGFGKLDHLWAGIDIPV